MQFNYVARTKTGEIQSGMVNATSREAAVEALQAGDLIVLSCVLAGTGPLWLKQIKIFQRVKFKDVVNFSRQLAILFSAKVSLVSGLQALSRQQTSLYFREILYNISNDVEAGIIFSKALAKYPKVFSPFYINLIKSGEVSGNLENTLNHLADHLEKQYYLASRLRSAMIYPSFVLFGFIVVAVLMLTMVIPNLTGILEESGQELPIVTRTIIGLSGFLRAWGWFLLLALIGLLVFLWRFARTADGRHFIDRLKLKLPIFGNVFKKIYMARFSENFSTLIKGGLPILQALQISGEVVGNVVFSDIIFRAKEEVRIGNTISAVFEKNKEEIPPMVTQMIFTGEKTGQLDMVLKKISTFYSQEVDAVVNNLSALVEPILIVFLGIGVAILLVAILMPIYNIAGGM
jgi:type IV pilus assembly protein PilC